MAASTMVVKEARAPFYEAKFQFAFSDRGRILSVDNGVQELLGFTPEDFLFERVGLADRIHADDRDYAAVLFSPTLKDRSGSLSLRVRQANGKIRCVRASFRKAERGGQIVLDLHLEDAKSLWRPLERNQLRSDLFRALMEKSEDIVFFKDRNHVYTAASGSLLDAVGMAMGGTNPVGLTDYDFLSEAEADAFYKPEKEVLAGAEVSRALGQVFLPDGKIRWMDDRTYPVRNEGGQITGLFAVARNVTERVEAEALLRQREAALEASQRIAGVGSYVFDVGALVWTGSDVMESLFGVERRSEHTVAEWLSLLHPEERDGLADYFNDRLAGALPFDRVYRIVRPSDGAVRWMHGMGQFELDANGRPATMLGAIRDITEQKLAEASLRESKELLQLFIEHAPVALAMYDTEMRVLAVSKRCLDVYGVSEEQVLGRSPYELVPNMPERWKQEHRRGLAGEAIRIDEDRLERADGTVRWLRRELLPWRKANGEVGGIITLTEDITCAKEADERLKLAANVFTHASEAIVITALDGSIMEVNEAFTRVTGYTRNEALGRNPRILQSGVHGKVFYEEMWRSIAETGHWRGEFLNRRKNGEIFASSSIVSTVYDSAGKPRNYVALFSDITPIKEQEKKLAQVAHFDGLTGLPNRTLLAERLRQAMAQLNPERTLAVAYFDLDLFKSINDKHGREAGDALLMAIAARMKLAMREGDTLARIGGDEFAAVLSDLEDVDAAVPILAELHRAADDPIGVGELQLQVSASAGVVFYPQAEDVDADQLLRQASQALYQAKVAGKNRYHVFDVTQDRTVRSHHEDIEHVRRALAGREFVLHYQPKVNMATGKLVGAEALLRWQHPQWGMLAPGMFLPIIEDHPLAVELGEWVIDTALTQLEEWHRQGLDIPVSVNLGALQLQDPEFIERLRGLLAAHPGVEPSSLELEVLETSALMDMGQVSKRIGECRGLGVSVALDDFGTGYSSLTYLKRLPANVLKIDQSFIRDMLSDPEDLAILEGILGLATAFRREPVAEGVETVEHGLLLLQLGCELAQGYGIARPMPADELPAWAASWKPDPRWASVAPLEASDWPVLYAGIEHQAWMKELGLYLKGERQSAPDGHEQCRLGAWLAAEKAGPRGKRPEFKEIEALHRRVHECGAEAVELKLRGSAAEADARVAAMGPLLDKALERLETLVKSN